MNYKYVVIVQCHIVHNRCSGFACTNDFYNRQGNFEDYQQDIPYISFTCGGCCGRGVSAKFEHFGNKIKKQAGINKDEVVVHLSSCMTNDNYHADRCPHIDYIKDIIMKKGFNHIVEGTYISKNATKLREKGLYKNY